MSETVVTTTTTTAVSTVNSTSRQPLRYTEESFLNAVYISMEVICMIEAISIIATNLLLLIVIVSSPTMRVKLRNHLVMSLVVANLIVGVFSSPFVVDIAVRRDWAHGCYFHVVRILLTGYVQNFVSLWGVVLLTLHYLCGLLQYDGPAFLVRLPGKVRAAIPGVCVALPWIAAVVLVVPLVFGSLHPYSYILWADGKCPIFLSRWVVYLLNVLTYFLPAICALAVIVAIITVYRRRLALFGLNTLKKMEMGENLVGDGEELEKPYVHVVVTLVTVIGMAPEHVYTILRLTVKMSWRGMVVGQVFVMLLSELEPVVLALVLLIMLSDVRMRLAELFSKLRLSTLCRSPPDSTETAVAPVSFKGLSED